jgi:hypothetical protein
MYEGRTRGKRIKYTYSDDEDMTFSDSTQRRSARNTGTSTPLETGTVTTSSGRQIRAPTRLNVDESAPGSVQGDMSEADMEASIGPTGRPRRAAAPGHSSNGWPDASKGSRRNDQVDSDDDGTEAEFGDDEEDVDLHVPEESEEEEDDFDDDEAMVDDDLQDEPQSLMVKLSVTPPKLRTVLSPNLQAVNFQPVAAGREDTKPEVQEGPLSEMKNGTVAQTDNTPMNSKVTASAEPMPKVAEPVDKNDRPLTPGSTQASASEMAPGAVALSATPLAYRKSPEKQSAQVATATVLSVGKQE